jgi:hypothetical protein
MRALYTQETKELEQSPLKMRKFFQAKYTKMFKQSITSLRCGGSDFWGAEPLAVIRSGRLQGFGLWGHQHPRHLCTARFSTSEQKQREQEQLLNLGCNYTSHSPRHQYKTRILIITSVVQPRTLLFTTASQLNTPIPPDGSIST